MLRHQCLSAFSLLVLSIFQSNCCSADVLFVDFDGFTGNSGLGPTAIGFERFDGFNGAAQSLGGVSVSISPSSLGGRDRGTIAGAGTFNESDLLRDFIFPASGQALSVTLDGLAPNTTYALSIWSHESILVDLNLLESWLVNGQTIASGFQYAAGSPNSNEQYRIDALVDSGSVGRLTIEGASNTIDSVRLNALSLTLIPEPTSAGLLVIALVAFACRRHIG